jgi:hypothetical protein
MDDVLRRELQLFEGVPMRSMPGRETIACQAGL